MSFSSLILIICLKCRKEEGRNGKKEEIREGGKDGGKKGNVERKK